MITIHLTALGLLRQYIPSPVYIDVEEGLSLKQIVLGQGIPEKALGAFMVNGKIKKDVFIPADGDDVKMVVLMAGG